MDRNTVIGIVLLVIAGTGVYVISMRPQASSEMESGAPASNSMDAHMKMMNDGKTVMDMGGVISPEVLFVKPGQEIRFANHEPYENQLKTADGHYSTPVTEPRGESIFLAPQTPGRYIYISSHNPKIKSAIVVEE